MFGGADELLPEQQAQIIDKLRDSWYTGFAHTQTSMHWHLIFTPSNCVKGYEPMTSCRSITPTFERMGMPYKMRAWNDQAQTTLPLQLGLGGGRPRPGITVFSRPAY